VQRGDVLAIHALEQWELKEFFDALASDGTSYDWGQS
jgi:hypothetical protein